MDKLKKATQICLLAHSGQYRHDGITPYHTHPVAVASKFEDETYKIVALLHDVVEDTDITLGHLYSHGFSEEILAAVATITKVEGQDYEKYIDFIKGNVIAKAVKIEDIKHNISCMDDSIRYDRKKIKYAGALDILETK